MHDAASPASLSTRCAGDRCAAAPITRIAADAYTIPADVPGADGTVAWNPTTLVVAEVEAASVAW